MNIFKRKKPEVPTYPIQIIGDGNPGPSTATIIQGVSNYAPKQSEEERLHAALEDIAKNMVEGVRAEQPGLLEKFLADHKQDVDGYTFDCKKHGDFLSLFITRKANTAKLPDRIPYSGYGDTLATTINLRDCLEIRLVPGHPPDMLGETRFSYTTRRVTDDCLCTSHTYRNRNGADGTDWIVEKARINLMNRPLLIVEEKPYTQVSADGRHTISNEPYYMPDWGHKIKTVVDNTARPAEDDVIKFAGVADLYVPASLGADVEAKIIKALES